MHEQRATSPDAEMVAALLQAIRDLVATVCPAASAAAVRLDSRLDSDLGLDSLAVAELLVQIEELFDVALPDELLARVKTPRDLLTSVAAASAVPVRARQRPAVQADSSTGSGPVAGDVDTLVHLLGEPRTGEQLRSDALEPETSVMAAGLRERQTSKGRQLLRIATTGLPAQVRAATTKAVELAYGVYTSALCVLFATVVGGLVTVMPGARRRWWIVRGAARLLFRLTGTRLSVEGAAHLPASGPYVVAANHASNLDPLVLAVVIPEPPVFAATGELAANPLARVLLRRLEAHLIKRGDPTRARAAIRTLTETVRSGRVVVFFPEGRRSHGVGLEPFKMGAFVIATDADVPVVPVALCGTRRILPFNRRMPRSGPITVTIAAPVLATHAGRAGAVHLQAATRTAILGHCGEPDLG